MTEIERTISTEDVDRIHIRLSAGDVSLRTGTANEIHLRARLHSNDETELGLQKSDGELLIVQQEAQSQRNRPIDLFLTVPQHSKLPITVRLGKGDVSIEALDGDLAIDTGKGDVAVSGGSGRLDVETGKGSVAVTGRTGALSIDTGKGDVVIRELNGPLHVQSGSGDVSIRDWQALADGNGNAPARAYRIELGSGDVGVQRGQAAGLQIRTGRGDISLEQARIPRLEVDTAKGDIHIGGDPGSGHWRCRTSKGDLNVSLQAGAAARVEAATRRGQIHSDLPQVKVGRPGPASQHGGGRTIGISGEEPRAEIELETVLGDIRVQATGTVAVPQMPAIPAPPKPPEPAALPTPSTGSVPASVTALSVLESLSQGKINVDEAEALLRSLEAA